MRRTLSLGVAITALAMAAPAALAQDATTSAEEIIVTGNGSQVNLAPAYAGGQVARGERAGLLGNLDMMDAPFAGTAYTDTLIQNQQAQSVGDVLQNDPVVRVAKGFGNLQEVYIIRGFPVFSDDMTYNGVYGILPRQFVASEFLERVEVFRGANSFLNGAAPGGSGVGGAFNLVPKRAGEDPLTRATLGYQNNGEAYGALDIGRRFGDFGVRLNVARRDGETSVDDQDRALSVVSLGADYDGPRLRLTADLGYQNQELDRPRPQVTPTTFVPRAPDADANYAQPWTFSNEEQTFGVVRGEVDVTDNITAWAAIGGRHGNEANDFANPTVIAAGGSTTATRFANTREDDIFSADTGIRAEFRTGGVGHRVILSYSAIEAKLNNAFSFLGAFGGIASNLYDPVTVTPPTAVSFPGGDLANPRLTEKDNNSSVALVDMMSLLDGRVLLTVGARQQNIEVHTYAATDGSPLSHYKSDATTPEIGIVYKPSDRVSVYANYSESLQPGAIAPNTDGGGNPLVNAGQALDPFRGQQYEIGVKYDAHVFAATLAAFQIDKPNPIIQQRGTDFVFTDGGEQQVQGLEATGFGEPVEGVRLIGGVTWLDAELSRTQGGVNQGNTPIGIPEWQANFNVEWDAPWLQGLTLNARVLYTGEENINEANTVATDAWARLDIGARYTTTIQNKAVTFRAGVENVTGENYWASVGGFPGFGYLVLGDPRTFTISASADF
ncbi:MAG: TonB-dependent receptor [Terricaulis sp.]